MASSLAQVWRRLRVAWTRKTLWKRRIVFFVGAVLVGCGAVVFAYLADQAHALFLEIRALSPNVPLLLTPAVFALAAWLTRRYFPGAEGSGIPQVIAARRSADPGLRQRLLGAKVTIGKVALTLLGLAAGASIGREGPTVQIGAAIMFVVASYAGIGRQHGLVLAGSAAGIAGAFNTPLAGIVFAIEEMAKSYERRMNGLVVAAGLIGGMTSLALVGQYLYFGRVSVGLSHETHWFAVALCGLVGGLFGGLFSRLVAGMIGARDGLLDRIKRWPAAYAAACGLVVAVLGLATAGYAFGTSYEETRMAVEHGVTIPWWYAPAKFVATTLSSVAGIPGGLFSPSLSVGAGIGSGLTHLLPGIDPRGVVLLAMAGYFAGVVQAPLTAFIIVLEMTADEAMLLPLLATSLMAAGVSRMVAPEPLYHALSFNYAPASSLQR